VRVQVLDPPAYTPPYDHALCAALARAGVEVELVTSRFAHGPVPAPEGYRAGERFYRAAQGRAGAAGRVAKLAGHVPGMLGLRRDGDVDLRHFQWLTLPSLDSLLLPPGPRVWTVHDPPPAAGARAAGWRRAARRMDALVAHSTAGAAVLAERLRVDPARVRVIPHGAFEHLTRLSDERPLPDELGSVEGPVVLCFGLIRPYKGIDVLLDAFREIEDAELWVVGRPMMPLAPLRDAAARCRSPVRFLDRFVTDPEIPAFFRRADLVVLPYREADQSGVLYTALAFDKPIVASAVGGFPDLAAHGALRLVPPADPAALAGALGSLLAEPAERERLAAAARAAADGPYSWDRIAAQTLDLYESVLAASG
jgi:glycosyltransferase involved in cell wall biosynthesis